MHPIYCKNKYLILLLYIQIKSILIRQYVYTNKIDRI